MGLSHVMLDTTRPLAPIDVTRVSPFIVCNTNAVVCPVALSWFTKSSDKNSNLTVIEWIRCDTVNTSLLVHIDSDDGAQVCCVMLVCNTTCIPLDGCTCLGSCYCRQLTGLYIILKIS